MPYFKNDKINILLIHIPKTGGTSIEEYLSNKYKIDLNEKSLYNKYYVPNLKGHSLQHYTYDEIYKNKEKFKIDYENIKIIATVRNPYDRIMSELFFQKILKKDEKSKDKNYVYHIIKNYLEGENHYDNHRLPQYKYIINDNGIIYENIIILRNENLNEEFRTLGFNDFNIHTQLNPFLNNNEKKNYLEYLNNDSIHLINEYYKKDFELFNYNMIKI
jgi:hypothetical protein